MKYGFQFYDRVHVFVCAMGMGMGQSQYEREPFNQFIYFM